MRPIPGPGTPNMIDRIRRHPVATYFVLAVAVSWIGILAIVFPTRLPASPEVAEQLFPSVYFAMLLGPSMAAVVVTGMAQGRGGLRDLRTRLFTRHQGARWYAVALLSAPVTLGVALLVLSLYSSDFAPALFSGNTDAAGPVAAGSILSFLAVGLAVGIGAGFFEELGWTGVAVPLLLKRHGILFSGFAVGLVWGGWHYLAIHWGSADAIGSVHPAVYLAVALFSFLPPYRVLMVWMYKHTRSLQLGILMHMSLTSSMLLLGPVVAGRQLLIFDLAFGATLWIAAGMTLALESRRRGLVKAGLPALDQPGAVTAP